MTDSFIVHVNESSAGEPYPGDLPPHRIVRSCEAVFGYPVCLGAAHRGPEACTCSMLTPEQLDQCVVDAWAAYFDRQGDMCADCAFRKGSPEEDNIAQIAANRTPFRCHEGMPVDARCGYPVKDAYAPVLAVSDGNITAPDYPICAGWLRAHAALAKRAPG